MSSWWEKVVRLAIRPPRAQYELSDLPGPHFTINGRLFYRKDIQVTNAKGGKLQCSYYKAVDMGDAVMPCVVYCHGNSGCQRDACEILRPILSANITVFAFDFSGSGRSDGELITLGINEAEDLEAVITYLRGDGRVSKVALWGRSMGAATAILYGQRDPSIAALVLDSSFSRFNDLAIELVETHATNNGIWCPRAMIRMVLSFFRRSVKLQTGADIDKLDVIAAATTSFIPARFGCATGDTFVPCHHTERLHEAYMGDKQLVHFDGEHNGIRPGLFYDSSSIFLHNVLQPPDAPLEPMRPGGSRNSLPSIRGAPPVANRVARPPVVPDTASPLTAAPRVERHRGTPMHHHERGRISGEDSSRGGSRRNSNSEGRDSRERVAATTDRPPSRSSRTVAGEAPEDGAEEAAAGGRAPLLRKRVPRNGGPREADLVAIEAMGFTRQQAQAALAVHNNVTLAVNLLLETGGQVPAPETTPSTNAAAGSTVKPLRTTPTGAAAPVSRGRTHTGGTAPPPATPINPGRASMIQMRMGNDVMRTDPSTRQNARSSSTRPITTAWGDGSVVGTSPAPPSPSANPSGESSDAYTSSGVTGFLSSIFALGSGDVDIPPPSNMQVEDDRQRAQGRESTTGGGGGGKRESPAQRTRSGIVDEEDLEALLPQMQSAEDDELAMAIYLSLQQSSGEG